ncbi:MAG: replication-associated recombination protein A [Thermodesulfovibrionales bacterium]|nr:replication-associated recombination protein A [Thermodesulfovibrionales bacterium]
MNLFTSGRQPLAWRMQPEDIEEFVGQRHLLAPGKPLRRLIEEDRLVSVIFYGPPGTGKTCLARIIARRTSSQFLSINAVTSGIKEIRDALQEAKKIRTILFIDEIHRFNKLQQDALLPAVESGEIILIGASTYNPFFSLVPALSSRSMIFQFYPLNEEEIILILKRALSDRRGLGGENVFCSDEVLKYIASLSQGDARKALNILELSFFISDERDGRRIITAENVKEAVQKKTLYYDEQEHYDTISAFIKSLRGSDPDAAIYWLAKMLEAGEDPLYIARRIVICASEDVGNADPQALVIAQAAMEATERIGMPEARIILSQAAIYVAQAPKSNASYLAIESALEDIKNRAIQPVPSHLKDSHYKGASRLGAGAGYKYPHDYEGHYVNQAYMPLRKIFYIPSEEGFERVIRKRLERRRSRHES